MLLLLLLLFVTKVYLISYLTLNYEFMRYVCIVFKQLYSASSGVNRSEALPVCKAPWEKIGFEKGKGTRKTAWKKSRAHRRSKCVPKSDDQFRQRIETEYYLLTIYLLTVYYCLHKGRPYVIITTTTIIICVIIAISLISMVTDTSGVVNKFILQNNPYPPHLIFSDT